jgi:hypothetical protein
MIYAHVAQKKLVNIKSPLDVSAEKSSWNKINQSRLKNDADNQQHLLRLSGDKIG